MRKLFIFLFILISFCLNAQTKGTFIDNRDNKTYKWIKIGEQTWMAENLKYNDTIFYNCDQIDKKNDTLKLVVKCPDGWHIPSVSEWTVLINKVGRTTASATLRDKNGFNAILNGRYNFDQKSVENKGTHAYFWSSTERDIYSIWAFFIYGSAPSPSKIDGDRRNGLSIRCVKDK